MGNWSSHTISREKIETQIYSTLDRWNTYTMWTQLKTIIIAFLSPEKNTQLRQQHIYGGVPGNFIFAKIQNFVRIKWWGLDQLGQRCWQPFKIKETIKESIIKEETDLLDKIVQVPHSLLITAPKNKPQDFTLTSLSRRPPSLLR